MLRFIIGKVRSKDLKRGPTEAKQEISNYLDNSGVPRGLSDGKCIWMVKTLPAMQETGV